MRFTNNAGGSQMKRTVILICVAVLTAPVLAKTTRGYIKKDGTYVAPHQRSAPNGTQRDNWGSKGNVNPYTGKEGTREPKK